MADTPADPVAEFGKELNDKVTSSALADSILIGLVAMKTNSCRGALEPDKRTPNRSGCLCVRDQARRGRQPDGWKLETKEEGIRDRATIHCAVSTSATLQPLLTSEPSDLAKAIDGTENEKSTVQRTVQ